MDSLSQSSSWGTVEYARSMTSSVEANNSFITERSPYSRRRTSLREYVGRRGVAVQYDDLTAPQTLPNTRLRPPMKRGPAHNQTVHFSLADGFRLYLTKPKTPVGLTQRPAIPGSIVINIPIPYCRQT